MRFLELRRQCGVSHEVRRGAQGASRVASGKSGLHARGEGGASWLSSHGRGLGPRYALKKDSRSLCRGRREASFPSPSAGYLTELPRVPLRGEGYCEVGGALGTPLGLDQWKRASSRMEAGTSGFLSISESDRRVSAE